MVITERKVVYKAFGLSLLSEIPLPELSSMTNPIDSIDVEIRVADLTGRWAEMADKQDGIVIRPDLVMFDIPETATFLIEEGKRITVSPADYHDQDQIRLWILGTCMGALLMQRRILPLHGSAVAVEGKAYAIIGKSGSGKSTLASAFINQGFQLLTDDVIAVTFSADHIPLVTPSYPQQKLWRESLQNFGMGTEQFRSIYGREDKYCIPVTSHYFADSLPLAGIFELKQSDSQTISLHPVHNLERLGIIYQHTFRNFFIPRMGILDWHFHTSTKVAGQTDIFQLYRPTSGFSANQLVSIILSSINKGE